MRRLFALLSLALILPLLVISVRAEDPLSELEKAADPEQGLSSEILQEVGPYDGSVEGIGVRILQLLSRTLGQIRELGLDAGLRSLGVLLAAGMLCAILEQSEHGKAAVPLVGALIAAAVCLSPMDAMIRLGTETIRQMHRYVELLLPGMTTLMAASGGLAASGTAGLGILLFDLLLSLVSKLLVPLLYLFLMLAFAESGLGLRQLAKLRDLVTWLLVTAVKGIMWAYSAILSLTGLVSGAVDAQKLRTLRSAIAGMVPVVGNMVSEASGSLLGAASLLRLSAGLYGMLAVLGICLGPFFRIALQYLLLKLATALCGLMGKGSLSGLLEKLCQAMGLMLALTGVCCLLALMILVLCIRTVTP